MADYAVVNPATGVVEKEYPTTTASELAAAIGAADSAYRAWALTTSPTDRAEIVRRIGILHSEHRLALANIIVREMGKPIAQALGELDLCADIYRYYADNGPGLLADTPIRVSRAGASAIIRHQPLGVLLGVMPWNFPCYQVARFCAPNLIVGNTILLKHAPQCPESAQAIEEIFREAGLEPGAYVNLYATNEQVEQIIADPRVQGVSVTGSQRAGAAVAQLAGKYLKKVVLELGGSDPFIVLGTDDMDATVSAAVAARLDNCGQSCNAAKRFIVIDSLYDEFLQKFTDALTAAKPTDPTDEATVLGPLSSAAATHRLSDQVARAFKQGAHIVGGGHIGNFFQPTVLTNVTPENDAYREELFGPVAAVYRARSEDDAIRLANDTSFGLGSYVFTTDKMQAMRVANAIEAGMVYVNIVGADSAELPFGGVKCSGFGRELGDPGMTSFVNDKLIMLG